MSAAVQAPGTRFDPLLVGAALSLVVLGAIMVSSASVAVADRDAGEPLYYFQRHLAALGVGGIGALVAAAVPSEVWYRLNWLLLLAALVLLGLVLVPGVGVSVNGASRWLAFGALRLQPSEPARLCLLMYIASYAVRHRDELASSLKGFGKPMLIVMAAGVLLLAEPDYGATVVLTATVFAVLFVAGARLRDCLLAVALAVVAFSLLAVSQAYRVQRLAAFLDPWGDPYDTGFQLTNSLIAIGRGDWLGVGLGASVQKLFYLPEAHTDFVFAVVAEELGFAGATLVIVLFAVLVYRAIALGRRALDAGLPFQGLLCTGIGVTFGLEAFVNIGVSTGLLPTKGLTLPLVSYGRASTVITLIALGLLMRIDWELRTLQPRPGRRSRGG